MSEIEKQISILHELQCKCVENGFYGDIELAEKALREKQERGKGCEYCNPQIMDGNPIIHSHADHYIGNGKFSVAGISARCCPMCGRKLGENDERH